MGEVAGKSAEVRTRRGFEWYSAMPSLLAILGAELAKRGVAVDVRLAPTTDWTPLDESGKFHRIVKGTVPPLGIRVRGDGCERLADQIRRLVDEDAPDIVRTVGYAELPVPDGKGQQAIFHVKRLRQEWRHEPLFFLVRSNVGSDVKPAWRRDDGISESDFTSPVSAFGRTGEAIDALRDALGRTISSATATAVVRNKLGMHARPCMQTVDLANRFMSEVTLAVGGSHPTVSDGKSIIEVMVLVAAEGTPVTISAQGPDAPEAVEAIRNLIESGFGEE